MKRWFFGANILTFVLAHGIDFVELKTLYQSLCFLSLHVGRGNAEAMVDSRSVSCPARPDGCTQLVALKLETAGQVRLHLVGFVSVDVYREAY